MRVDARSVMIFRLSTTPGTTSCSRPGVEVLGVLADDDQIDALERATARPGRFHTGRRFAYRSSALRSPTLTLVKPSPIGVVTGPLSATLFRRMDSRSVGGQRVPRALERDDARHRAVPSRSRRRPPRGCGATASVTSGPMPSPGMSVMV